MTFGVKRNRVMESFQNKTLLSALSFIEESVY